MKILKILALPLLLLSGTAHSSVYGLEMSWTTTVTGCPLCAGPGAGTGTWDTATNVIDFTGIENLHIDFDNETPASNAAVARHFTIDTDALTYTYITTACDDGGTDTICNDDCDGCNSGWPKPLGDKIYLLDPIQQQTTGFVWDGVRRIRTLQTSVQYRTFTFTILPPAIPVPSAALLFGSAMGLLGIGRNRHRKRF